MFAARRRRSRSERAGGEFLSIGEMAQSYGVTLRALRFYEARGMLQPQRDGSSRFYNAAARHQLELILRGKKLGFKLSEIRNMLMRDDAETAPAQELTMDERQVVAQIDLLQRERENIEQAIIELKATRVRMTSVDPAAQTAMASETHRVVANVG